MRETWRVSDLLRFALSPWTGWRCSFWQTHDMKQMRQLNLSKIPYHRHFILPVMGLTVFITVVLWGDFSHLLARVGGAGENGRDLLGSQFPTTSDLEGSPLPTTSDLEGSQFPTTSTGSTTECSLFEAGQKGSTRCGEKDVWFQFGHPLPVRIYQLYHSVENHHALYDCSHGLYQGLAQTPGAVRFNTRDIDATANLPILNNSHYQNNLCEYSGMFGILASGHMTAQKEPYIGFQSWKASKKNADLSCEAETTLVRGISESLSKGTDTIFYWAHPHNGGVTTNFYYGCDFYLNNRCSQSYAQVFRRMFELSMKDDLGNWLPGMTDLDEEWIYMSYFALPTARYKEYLEFAALFFALLDDEFHDGIVDQTKCPHAIGLIDYKQRHCMCYLMERLINIWAFHSGLRFIFIQPQTGAAKETHLLSSRKMVPWFTDGSFKASKARLLKGIASRNDRDLYNKLAVGL